VSNRGHDRERALVLQLRNDDWIAGRAPGSLGVDVWAMKAGRRPRLIEVKSTAGGPYERFGPAERRKASLAGRLAGADVFLVWWPPRRKPTWIPEGNWPPTIEPPVELLDSRRV
jgi:hypothetical protein